MRYILPFTLISVMIYIFFHGLSKDPKIVPVKKIEKKQYKIHSAIKDLIKVIKNEKLLEYK